MPPAKTTVPVKGKVYLNGTPVSLGKIVFEPKDPKGIPASGFISADGSFELRTYSNTEADGVVPGEYDVGIEPHNVLNQPAAPKGVEATAIPANIKDPKTSGVSIKIDAENDNLRVDFK